jgi:hypothetical protein
MSDSRRWEDLLILFLNVISFRLTQFDFPVSTIVSEDGPREYSKRSGVRVPVGAKLFSPLGLDRQWGTPDLLSNWYRGLFPWE